MSNFTEFVPAYRHAPAKDMAEFISFCKEELTTFGPDFSWESNHWPEAKIFFGNWEVSRHAINQSPLQQPLLDFAKAYVRYTLSFKTKPQARYEGTIFKCIEKALNEAGHPSDISILNHELLDRASELARERFSKSSSYHIGRNLQKLAEFVSTKQLIPNHLDWKNPNSRVIDTVRTGLKAQKVREKKLPSEIALNALAEVFASNPAEPGDIFVTSTCAIMLCVPSRISEVLALHENCEVHEKRRDGSEAYGIRFLPGKGAPPQIKWVPTAMVSLAKEAIRRLRTMTDEARRIALWYEKNPDKFYRHPDCPNVADDDYLTINQRTQALGQNDNSVSKSKYMTLSLLQQHVMTKQPKDFPWFDKERKIKCSEALFCFQLNQLSPNRAASKVNVYKPVASTLLGRISKKGKGAGLNFFDTHGYKGNDGKTITLTTHAFRHLLNTMAQRGGMSQIEIARWSGRVEIKQNRVYDHMSEFEIVDILRKKDSELVLHGSLEELRKEISKKLPIDRQAFNILAIPTAHITEIGYCVHDYSMSPCQKHLDCLNCSEQICVKGDIRLKNIQDIFDKSTALLKKMEADIASGAAGADRWYEHTKLTLKRAENLLAILNDFDIPNGTFVKLHNPNEFSPLNRALEAQGLKKLKQSEALDKARLLMED